MNTDPESLHMSQVEESFVDVLASSTSKSGTIFRRFDKLTLASILHQQEKLQEHEEHVDYRGPNIKAQDCDSMDKVSDAVKKYHETLFYYSQNLKLSRPGDRTLNSIQRWVNEGRIQERSKYSLIKTGSDEFKEDLISLYTPVEEDRLSRFLAWSPLRVFFLDVSRTNLGNGVGYLDEDKLKKFVTFLGALIAIAFLIGAMWVVWAVDNPPAQLGAVTGFVVGFTFWANFFTNAQRKEVYAASAAYAAVLVVFAAK